MIFNCPSCSAGHSVPVSMIPNGGLDMLCRRCTEQFRIDMPQGGEIPIPEPTIATGTTGERTNVGTLAPDEPFEAPRPQANVEPTAVGVVNPFDEEEPSRRPLMSPSGIEIALPIPKKNGREDTKPDARVELRSDTRPEIRGSNRKKTPVTHGRGLPPGPNEMGVDPELDETVRVGLEHERELERAPLAPRISTGAPIPISAHPTPTATPATQAAVTRDSATIPPTLVPEKSVSNPKGDLYERVAAGVYVPEEPAPRADSTERERESHPDAKAWNQRSVYLDGSSPFARLVGPLRIVAETLNRLPLPFKVGLVVFPLALGTVLVITSGRNPWTNDPVQIAIPTPAPAIEVAVAQPEQQQPQQQAQPIPTPAPARDKAPEPEDLVAPPPVPKPARPVFDDAPAGEGHAYVQVDRARLRTHASDDGQMVAKLDLGQRVKKFDSLGDWVLVMAVPNGPAGFISERLLGPRKPIALLAREVGFASCELADDRTRDDCLYHAKEQNDACLQACGPAIGAGSGADPESSPAVRCAEACRVAFSECQRTCNEPDEDRRARVAKKKTKHR